MKNPKIILGTDHAGFNLKEEIKQYLQKENFQVEDEGAHSLSKEDDYPEFISKAAEKVSKIPNSKGIIFGASGQGEAIVANKFKGIRAVVYNTNNLKIIKLSRTHNDANILSLGARFLSKKEAILAVKTWLETDFNKEKRHIRRIKQTQDIEEKTCR
tara:strand:- start:430 stop:900 length:471 start_codon:yes stop_codon:yes gene_type:complete